MKNIFLILLFIFAFSVIGHTQAMYSDRADDYIILGSTPFAWIDFDVPMTFMCWVNVYVMYQRQNGVITSMGSGGGQVGFAFEPSSWGECNFYMRDADEFWRATTAGTTLSSHTWQHIAVVYEGQGLRANATFYINGIQMPSGVGSGTKVNTTIKSNRGVQMCRTYWDRPDEAIEGELCELRLYKGIAKVDDIKQAMFDVGSPSSSERLQLMNYYPLDSVNYIVDRSTHGVWGIKSQGAVLGCVQATSSPNRTGTK